MPIQMIVSARKVPTFDHVNRESSNLVHGLGNKRLLEEQPVGPTALNELLHQYATILDFLLVYYYNLCFGPIEFGDHVIL
jgi:hypothetical protein